MQSKLIAVSAAVLALFAGQAAQASASASATVSNIKFYVYDMDLTDGVAATASFFDLSESAYTFVLVNGGFANGVSGTLPNSANLSLLGASASGSVVGAGTLDSFALSAQANSDNGRASGSGQLYLDFSLSNNAMLVLSADVTAAASTTVGNTAAGSETAYGWGEIGFYTGVNGASVGSYGYVEAYNPTNDPFQISQSGTALAVIQNTSGAEMDLYGNVRAYAQVSIPLSVPEPQTYAMLLAGLGVVGLLQRRRRQA